MRQKKTSKMKEIILEHISTNLKEYIITFIIFVIGIIVGMMLLNNLNEEQKAEISQYVYNTIDSLKETTTIDTITMLKNSIINNMFFCLVIWFVGSTIVGLPIVYAILAFKGFSIGYTISAVVAVLGTGKGMIFVITTMLLQNIIFIPCAIALVVSATRLCKSIIKDRRRENIKYGIIKHTLFSLVICIFLVLSSFVEVYISTNLFNLSLELFK